MAGINKVILVGNLGQDPEMRYMPNGNAVANIRIATSESWTDQQGQRQERTEWHSVVMFRKLGEIAGQYLKKGSKVYVEGKLQTRKWQDQNGNDRYTTEIVADQMQMLDSRGSQGGQNNQNNQGNWGNNNAAQGGFNQAAPSYNQGGQGQGSQGQGGGYNQNQSRPAPAYDQMPPAAAPMSSQGNSFNSAPSAPAPQSQPAAINSPKLDDGWDDDDIPF